MFFCGKSNFDYRYLTEKVAQDLLCEGGSHRTELKEEEKEEGQKCCLIIMVPYDLLETFTQSIVL